jgi:hypothetical protein
VFGYHPKGTLVILARCGLPSPWAGDPPEGESYRLAWELPNLVHDVHHTYPGHTESEFRRMVEQFRSDQAALTNSCYWKGAADRCPGSYAQHVLLRAEFKPKRAKHSKLLYEIDDDPMSAEIAELQEALAALARPTLDARQNSLADRTAIEHELHEARRCLLRTAHTDALMRAQSELSGTSDLLSRSQRRRKILTAIEDDIQAAPQLHPAE